MILPGSFAARIHGVFEPMPRGVVGLVDDLLELCREHQLRISFQDNHCYVRSLDSVAQDALAVPLPKSVCRAVLARIAVLCNEHTPGSATPYRGEGKIPVPAPIPENGSPPSTCCVEFTNTPSDQRLELRFPQGNDGAWIRPGRARVAAGSKPVAPTFFLVYSK